MTIKQPSFSIARSIVCFFFASVLLPNITTAQETNDFVFRQNIGVAWSPTKKTGLNAGYRLTMFENASRFRNSMFSVGMNYDIMKWWKVGGEYRYSTSSEQDFHRLQAFTRFDYTVNKVQFLYRLQYQQRQDYFNDEYLQHEPPRRVFRNRLMARYQYSQKLQYFAYTESFTRLRNGEMNWYRMRYGAGGEYLYKRRHSFNAELFVNDEFNLKNPENRLTAELSYVFHIDKKKKKKKKKNKSSKKNITDEE